MKQKINQLTIEFLERLGITEPTQIQIDLLEIVLSHQTICCQRLFGERLSSTEIIVLLCASEGYTINESATLLNLAPTTIKELRQRILQKLGCRNMAHAVSEGIRYGYLNNSQDFRHLQDRQT